MVWFRDSRGCAPDGRLTPGYYLPPFQGWDGRDHKTSGPSKGLALQRPAPTGRQSIARGFIPWYNAPKKIPLAPTGRQKSQTREKSPSSGMVWGEIKRPPVRRAFLPPLQGLNDGLVPRFPGLRSRWSLNPGLISAALSGLRWARSQNLWPVKGPCPTKASPNGAAEYSQGIHPLV